MYSKAESSRLQSRFWTSFGLYMAPVPAASGTKVNWVNYKTGIKNLYFRMDASAKNAIISIDITHRDEEQRNKFFDQFRSLEKILENHLGESWNWEENIQDISGSKISRIYTLLDGVNIFKETDWPDIIRFFKTSIIKLDSFWYEYHELFSAIQ